MRYLTFSRRRGEMILSDKQAVHVPSISLQGNTLSKLCNVLVASFVHVPMVSTIVPWCPLSPETCGGVL